MKSYSRIIFLIIAFMTLGNVWGLAYSVQEDRQPTGIEQRVRRALITLPNYTVFDNLVFRIEGTKVVLMGQVTTPRLKSDAGSAVRRVEDIESVENEIEVLPVSPNDERIRLAVYRALYYNPSFSRYAIRAVPPIHIIVKNGHVVLEGVVATEADKNLANLLARNVPGIFSVTNNLLTEKEGS